jgi:hypothetical protein
MTPNLTRYATISNSDLDVEIARLSALALPGPALDLAIDERVRRSRYMDAVLHAVRSDLEHASIFDDLDPVLDFVGPTTVLRFGCSGSTFGVGYAYNLDDVDATVASIRDALARMAATPAKATTPAPSKVSIRLPAGGLGLVIDELSRAPERESYARLTLRGSVLTGSRDDLRDLADGVEAVNSDEDLAMRAETIAADSRGLPTGDRLDARAEFIARALRKSRDGLLDRLHRGR